MESSSLVVQNLVRKILKIIWDEIIHWPMCFGFEPYSLNLYPFLFYFFTFFSDFDFYPDLRKFFSPSFIYISSISSTLRTNLFLSYFSLSFDSSLLLFSVDPDLSFFSFYLPSTTLLLSSSFSSFFVFFFFFFFFLTVSAGTTELPLHLQSTAFLISAISLSTSRISMK